MKGIASDDFGIPRFRHDDAPGKITIIFEPAMLLDGESGTIKLAARMIKSREPERHLICRVCDSGSTTVRVATFLRQADRVREIAAHKICRGDLRPTIDLAKLNQALEFS